MSTVFVINEDGVIVETLFATASYRSPLGKTVKPATRQEEMTLRLLSKINERIVEERKAVEKLKKEAINDLAAEYTGAVEQLFVELKDPDYEKFLPGQVLELMEQWRKASSTVTSHASPEAYTAQAAAMLRRGHGLRRQMHQTRLEYFTDQSAALQRIKTMTAELKAMEDLSFQMETADGTAVSEARVDLHTGGKLVGIQKELEQITGRIENASPEGLRSDLARLEELEQQARDLPNQARKVYNARLWRQEQIQNVADRLADNGWELVKFSQGDGVFDDSALLVKDARDRRAMISFSLAGAVRVDSFFDEDAAKSREHFQQLVVGALRDGGDKKAAGRCMDGEPGGAQHRTGPQVRTEDAAPASPERAAARREAAGNRERGHGHK